MSFDPLSPSPAGPGSTFGTVADPGRRRLAAIVAAGLVLGAVLAPPAFAQTPFDSWQEVGPEGGPLRSLIVDPLDGDRWLALSGLELLEKRGDGPWSTVGELPFGFGSILVADGPTLFAVLTGSSAAATSFFFRSDDGGSTWVDLAFPNGVRIDTRAVVRAPSGLLFATSDGLWRWRRAEGWDQLLGDFVLDLDMTDDGSLAAALVSAPLSTEERVLESTDGGLTWGEAGGLAPRRVESVAVEGSSTFAIGTDLATGDRFAASRPAGPGLWTVVPAQDLPERSFTTSLDAFSRGGATVLFSGRPPRTYRSADLGRTWRALDLGDGAVSDLVYGIRPGTGGALLAAGRAGAFSSSDGGLTWREENRGPSRHFVEAIAVDPARPDELYVRTSSLETFSSEDGGATWRRLPLPPTYGDLVILDTEPRVLLTGAEDGWLRSEDGGLTFTLIGDGDGGDQRVEDFSVDPADPRRLVAAGSDRDGATAAAHWWSNDAGATWTRGAAAPDGSTLGPDFFVAAHDPFRPGRVYMAGSDGVFAGEDGGARVTPLPGAGTFVRGLAVDPFTPGRLLASSSDALFRSDDAGATWTSLSDDPPFDVFSDLRADRRVRDRYWAESGAGLWRSDDAGVTWRLASPEFPDLVNTFDFDPRFPRTVYAGAWRNGLLRLLLDDGLGCDHPQLLCLGDGRFVLESRWRDFEGREGLGQKADLTADTGYFWFFDPANVELVTKVLDGRGFNGNYWVFYGSLSNVEFDLKVTDTASQQVVAYRNPSGNFASVGDTAALPELAGLGGLPGLRGTPAAPALEVEGCDGLDDAICIGDRFRLSATWRDFEDRSGAGAPNDLTDDTAFFTFFSPSNVELMVKVLDGRGFNGRYWVFFASLSNVEFTLTVEDLETGAVRTYRNPRGNFASVGDTAAF
ncbi:MAG: hypothetical protein AAGF23_07445 [Acidobacteriota bacterium]